MKFSQSACKFIDMDFTMYLQLEKIRMKTKVNVSRTCFYKKCVTIALNLLQKYICLDYGDELLVDLWVVLIHICSGKMFKIID